MSWIFITLVLTVVTGGSCNEAADCSSSQLVLMSPADNTIFAVVTPPSCPTAAQFIFNQTDQSFDLLVVNVLTVSPEFTPLPRSSCIPSRFSGTSPPIV